MMKTQSLLVGMMLILSSWAWASKDLPWGISSFLDYQIFPSYSWTVAHLGQEANNDAGNFFGDATGQFGVVFYNGLKKGQTIKIVVAENSLMEESSLEFTMLLDVNQPFYGYPQIQYKWDAFENWRQPKPINLKISVYVDGEFTRTENQRMIARSINDCPFGVATDFGFADSGLTMVVDMKYVFLSYVNENHPIISNHILPEIMNEGIINRVIGYQGVKDGNYDSVYKQVFAVWHYFHKNNFYYSSLDMQAKADAIPFVISQYVRTFGDVYATKQANCVDGTILMASILMRMGIDPYLVIVPGHCYLGFSLDGSPDNLSFLETTNLGTRFNEIREDDQEFVKDFKLLHDDDFKAKLGDKEESYNMFVYSVIIGFLDYSDNKDKFVTPDDKPLIPVMNNVGLNEAFNATSYELLSVRDFRIRGLLPLNL